METDAEVQTAAASINGKLYQSVKDAIESATSVKLEDGTQKITITLREEADPAVTAPDADKAASFTSAMFPVVTADVLAEKVNETLMISKISSASVTYSDCTVEVIYNPTNGAIISIVQTVNYTGSFKGMLLTSSGTVTEISEYRNFNY